MEKNLILILNENIISDNERQEIIDAFNNEKFGLEIWTHYELVDKNFPEVVEIVWKFVIDYKLIDTLVQRGSFDVFKHYFLKIWDRKLNKTTKSDDNVAVIEIEIEGNPLISFKFDKSISNKLKEKCIDQSFEFMKKNKLKNDYGNERLPYFDNEKEIWIS